MQNVRNNIAVSIIVAIFLLSLSEITESDRMKQFRVSDVNAKEQNAYILKEYNGLIGLFNSGGSTPCEVYDVIVKYLPESDIAALSQGIIIVSDEQLRSLIEDYSG